jgi:hypothetical protein
MGSEDNTNTQSEQSDAEVTRVVKMRICDTPKDWARRIAIKYSDKGGDCMFPAFIERFGNDEGVFREPIGDMRQGKGIPKPNSRSLENALAEILPYFQIAKASGVGVTVFMDAISTKITATVGANVASRYTGFLSAMLSQAIPLADELLKSGKLDEAKLTKLQGAGAKASDRDFSFRFGTALADAFIDRVAFSAESEKARSDPAKEKAFVAESVERMCKGLANLDPGVMNSSLSRVMNRLSVVANMASMDGARVQLKPETYEAFAEGFASAVKKGYWDDPAAAEKDFLAVVAGSNNVAASKTKKTHP